MIVNISNIVIKMQGITPLGPYLPIGLTQSHHFYSKPLTQMIKTTDGFLTFLYSNVHQLIKCSIKNICNGTLHKIFS